MSDMVEDKQFAQARQHLANLSDQELKDRFWQLTEALVDPLLDLGRHYTSPSVERSVLLRMGFSSIESTKIVDQVINAELMGKGAGHIVYRIAKENDLPIRQAGLALAEGKYWDQVNEIFKGV